MRPSIVAVAATALIGVASCKAPAETQSADDHSLSGDFDADTIEIVNADGDSHAFDVYLAQTYEQQRRGLMFVRKLPERTGMLFVYDSNASRSMWMKNTFIPLDLVFAGDDGIVSSIIHNAEPLTLQSRRSVEPVTYVLELNGGVARRYKIEPGSRIIWP